MRTRLDLWQKEVPRKDDVIGLIPLYWLLLVLLSRKQSI